MKIFDDTWMKAFMEKWNHETTLIKDLATINFSSTIGYGFPDKKEPTGFLTIKNGQCIEAGQYDGRNLQWDLRAEEKNWGKWLTRETGITGLGLAFETGKLIFKRGDFSAMISNASLANSFAKSFNTMARV